MPQSFLETGQHIDVRSRLDIDRAPCRQTDLFQGGREHILTGDNPEHLATRAGRYARAELSGGRTMQRIIPASCHFMQRTQRQAATGQAAVDLVHAKGQHLAASVTVPFETTDRGPQRFQARFFPGFSSHFTARCPLFRCIS